MNSASKINFFDFDQSSLEAFIAELGEKPYRAQQLMKWVYHQLTDDFSEMTNVSKSFREKLSGLIEIVPPVVHTEKISSDGTRKWLLSVGTNNAIETVFIPEANRGTLCISSQVGCALNCQFCSTATQGFSRDLTTAEIIGQVWVAARALGHSQNNRKITNVVMMGMGEPLMNFEPVIKAMSLMRNDFGFGLSSRRVTLSTAGLVPGIDLLKERIEVSLAVSLHAADDVLRSKLVPLNKKYPIKVLLDACRRYINGRHRVRVTFEYTLIDGVNDSPEQARALVKLLRTVPSKLNLIPFNPFPGTEFKRSTPEAIERFKKIVMDAKVIATVRKTRGDDIDAACGQLVGQVMDRTKRQQRHREKLALQVVTA